jgi:DNA-binding response OmpR family regulator
MAIVDLSLPGTGGLKVIEHLRRTSATYMMPILVLTGNRDPAAAEEAMGVGANAVMTKPFEPDDLVAKVSEVLRQNPFPARN